MRNLKLILIFIFGLTIMAKAQSGFNELIDASQDPQAAVQLYPNPSTEFLTVKINGVKVSNLQVVVRNIIGNVINVDLEFLAEDELRIRVKDLPVGYYLLAIRDEAVDFKGTYKFLKR